MASGRRVDPEHKFRFRVVTEDFPPMGFVSVDGLRSEAPVFEVEEGGNPIPWKFPDTHMKFGNVAFSRGKGDYISWQSWMEDMIFWQKTGTPKKVRDIRVMVIDKVGNEALGWAIFDAWPTLLEIEGLDANSDDVLIERMEFACRGFKEVRSGAGGMKLALGGFTTMGQGSQRGNVKIPKAPSAKAGGFQIPHGVATAIGTASKLYGAGASLSNAVTHMRGPESGFKPGGRKVKLPMIPKLPAYNPGRSSAWPK